MRRKISQGLEEAGFQPPRSCQWYERPIVPAPVLKRRAFQVGQPHVLHWVWLAASSFGLGISLFYFLDGRGTAVTLVLPPASFGGFLVGSYLSRRFASRRVDVERDRMAFLDGYRGDTWFTSATIYRNGAEVGRDNGVAWFEDGSLMFSGLRCSFAITGEDIRRSSASIGWRSARIADFSPACLLLRHPTDIILVRFRPAQSQTADEIFISKFVAFRASSNLKGRYRQYPPLERPHAAGETTY